MDPHPALRSSARGPLVPISSYRSKKVWLFPLLLLLPVLLMTALRIHGSSIGIYNRYLYGSDYKDSNLIFGEPQPIRGDEWLVATPFTVSQAKNGYPRINPDVGYGQDMSIMHADMPYLEWSSLFRPLNLGFFVLPLENAFALKWWLLGYVLIISCFLVIVELLQGRVAFAALMSLAVFLSPFIQWFYLSSTVEPLAYSLLSLFLFIRLLRTETVGSKAAWTLALSYVLVCFTLVLYPPLQIASALGVGFFILGYVISEVRRKGLRPLLPSLGLATGAVVVAAVVTAVFFATRIEAIRAVTGTAYPGDRIADTGTYPLSLLFASHLLPVVQMSDRAAHYDWNQTEASNFVFIAPFLLTPSIYTAFRNRHRKPAVAYPMLFVNLGILLLALLMLVPGLEAASTLLFLRSVPSQRLVIGLGLLGVLQIVLLHRWHDLDGRPAESLMAWPMTLAALGAFVVSGLYIRSQYPGFVDSWVVVILLSVSVTSIVFLYLRGRFLLATLLLLAFSAASVFRVNPLYRGLDPLLDSRLGPVLKSIGDADGGWVVVGDFPFEQYPRQYGLRSFSGVYFYPQPRIWRPIDPMGRQRHVWNRYAHVIFSPNFERLKLGSPDTFGAPFEACSPFMRENRIRHVLAVGPIAEGPCLARSRTVAFPVLTFYIYRVDYKNQSAQRVTTEVDAGST
jgi:hypothetical protein